MLELFWIEVEQVESNICAVMGCETKPMKTTLSTILVIFVVLDACQGFTLTSSCSVNEIGSRKMNFAKSLLKSQDLLEAPPTILGEEILSELLAQDPNEHAPALDIQDNQDLVPVLSWRPMEDAPITAPINRHFEMLSLDDLFPEQTNLRLSEAFNTCSDFRNNLREAIRHDMVFDDKHGFYTMLTTEQRRQEVINDKPLIGLWKTSNGVNRMKKTTEILKQYLGADAPTGDELFGALGALTNSIQAPYHWTEVVGVAATQNKKMGDKTEHAWHQDYGCLEKGIDAKYGNNVHVFLGFPCEDNYHGTGVLPHVIKLQQEQWIQRVDTTSEKPMFYHGKVSEEYVVRPFCTPGREIIVFRDVDVLHSTPDIQYRTSLMRFG